MYKNFTLNSGYRPFCHYYYYMYSMEKKNTISFQILQFINAFNSN